MPELDALPGFRRRVRIEPAPAQVSAALEDDYHRMAVTLHHDGSVVTGVDAAMPRAPWTTCPGAMDQLRQTFTGVKLRDVAARGDKARNCTHLHDLAILAAAHAHESRPLTYDILVSDPVDGLRRAEIRRDGRRLLGWTDEPRPFPEYNRLVEPRELAGQQLHRLRPWIETLDAERQEAARLLQWSAIVANGRSLPLEKHADASLMGTGRCYSFQEERAAQARRILDIRDFSDKSSQLLGSDT